MRDQHGSTAPSQADADGGPFWSLVNDGTLAVGGCAAKGHRFFPPGPACPECGDTDTGLVPVTGNGRVYSWVVVHRALDPAFDDEVPYTVVAVDLDEGARVLGRLVDEPAPGTDLAGKPVTFRTFRRDGMALVGFAAAP